MSSLPIEFTFLDSLKKNDKELPQNKLVEKYKKEIKYIEDEIQYWKNENEFSPSQSKNKKIEELYIELKKIQKIYENIINENKKIINSNHLF
jgi:hypothetical protein